jgi:hypothetical protein
MESHTSHLRTIKQMPSSDLLKAYRVIMGRCQRVSNELIRRHNITPQEVEVVQNMDRLCDSLRHMIREIEEGDE